MGQFQVVQAEQVQQRGIEVVDVNRVFDDPPAKLVGRADRPAAGDADRRPARR